MTSLASQVWGDADGVPVVLLHGALGTPSDWNFLPRIPGVRWVALELPGHDTTPSTLMTKKATTPTGQSTKDQWSVAKWARALEATLTSLDIERPVLVGYSMGGRLALHAAAERPSAFSSLVVVAGTRGLHEGARKDERREEDSKWADKVARSTTREQKRELLLTWWSRPVFGALRQHPEFDTLLDERVSRDLFRCGPALATLGTGTLPFVDVGRLNSIPLLTIAGAADQKFAKEAVAMATAASNGRAELIEGCAHALLVEAKPELMALLAGVVEDVQKQRAIDAKSEAAA